MERRRHHCACCGRVRDARTASCARAIACQALRPVSCALTVSPVCHLPFRTVRSLVLLAAPAASGKLIQSTLPEVRRNAPYPAVPIRSIRPMQPSSPWRSLRALARKSHCASAPSDFDTDTAGFAFSASPFPRVQTGLGTGWRAITNASFRSAAVILCRSAGARSGVGAEA